MRLSIIMLAALCVIGCYAKSGKGKLSERIGVCTSLENAEAIKAAGGHHVEVNLMAMLVPESDDNAFAPLLKSMKECALPIISTNCYMPGEIRLTGPEVDEARVLRYTEVAMRRAAEVGIKTTVLGSGWARSVPEGFSREKAEQQFVGLLKKMGPIAKKYGVTIAIEPLRKQECNFINTVQEGYEIAKKVHHPNICVNADLYHMMQEGETPQSILNAGKKYIRHIHIAENARRTPPGVDGEDFTPFFEALKKIKFKGSISIECGWENFKEQVGPAIREVKRQLEKVYGE